MAILLQLIDLYIMNCKKVTKAEAHDLGCMSGGKTVPDRSKGDAAPSNVMYGKMDAGTYVDLMSDAGFKAVFADKNNKVLLVKLLNKVLPDDVRVKDIIKYLDREQRCDTARSKSTRLDLVCQGEDGEIFSVEIQRSYEKAFFQRCVFYGSGLYHNQLLNAELYENLRPVYVIAFIDYNLTHDDSSQWDTDHIISRYRMIEERTKEFGPKTIFAIFAEMRRFTKSLEECRS